jgi:23S rRNA pseudouridine2605 synthase
MKLCSGTLVSPRNSCYQQTHLSTTETMPGKEEKDLKHGERIAKVMARAGLCSRRDAEAWIGQGRVVVNGVPVTSPALNIGLSDQVIVDGKPLPARERTRLFLYHKPRGLVTTSKDPQGRPTIFSALPKNLPRLVSVGRLDFNTEGLLLLTNDGGLARTLELPATGWLRRYRVRANGAITQDVLDGLQKGVAIDGVRYGAIEAKLDRLQGANVWITFSIREGKNREVRNVLSHLGLAVNRLIRVSFGPFQLGEQPVGTVEEVKTRVLREQLGDKLARAASVDFAGPTGDHNVPSPKAEELVAPARKPRIPLPSRAGERMERKFDHKRRPERGSHKGGDFRHVAGPEDKPRAASQKPRSAGRSKPRSVGGPPPGAHRGPKSR